MPAWTWPTRDPYVTSSWSPLRLHPVLHVLKAHTGADFRARTGADLLAVHAGTVVRSTYDEKVAGHYIRIDVGDGVWVGYSHASKRLVRVGDRVSAGQVIALAGSTGSASAAHLHFEVSVAGTKVDPVPYLAARIGVTLARTEGPILTGAIPTVPDLTLPDPLIPEDDMLVLAKLKSRYGDPRIWRGNGIIRTHVPDPAALGDIRAMIDDAHVLVGSATVHEVDDLDWLGMPLAEPDVVAIAKAVTAALPQGSTVDVQAVARAAADEMSKRLAG